MKLDTADKEERSASDQEMRNDDFRKLSNLELANI